MTNQKRNYSRVSAFFQGRARTVQADDEHFLFQGFPGSDAVRAAATRPKGVNIPDAMLDYLETINSKLDMLLSIANQEQLRQHFPIVVNIVEISGAGLIFWAEDHDFALKDKIELVLFLSQFPLQMVSAMGRIHREEEHVGRKHWVVDFTSIREYDREAIVRYVFQQQREQIRESKQWD
jgi:hypothetical protein